MTSPGNAQWAATIDEARAQAAEQKKLVFYEVDSQNCGECARMKSLLYPAFDFEALLIGMVPVRVDITTHDGDRLTELYGIKETPSVAIATPTGRLVFLMQGFKSQGDFFGHVHKSLDGYRAWAKTIDAQDVATLSAKEAYAIGAPAVRPVRLRRGPASLQARDGGSRRHAGHPRTRPSRAWRPPSSSSTSPRRPARRSTSSSPATKDPEVRERAELFRANIALVQNQNAEALSLYKKFEKDHPNSKYLEQVRGFITHLESPQ